MDLESYGVYGKEGRHLTLADLRILQDGTRVKEGGWGVGLGAYFSSPYHQCRALALSDGIKAGLAHIYPHQLSGSYLEDMLKEFGGGARAIVVEVIGVWGSSSSECLEKGIECRTISIEMLRDPTIKHMTWYRILPRGVIATPEKVIVFDERQRLECSFRYFFKAPPVP